MLHDKGHNQAIGPQRNQQIDPPNKQTWAIQSQCHPTIAKGIQLFIISQFNQSNPGKGMEKLLDNSDNLLTLVKSTDAITAGSVTKDVKKQADELTNTTSKTILPTITSQTEAQEEANQLSIINQLVISAKEGIVQAITKLVGSDITDAILQTADRSDHKSIDDFKLFKVLHVAINGKTAHQQMTCWSN
jgi:hypothetical protein